MIFRDSNNFWMIKPFAYLSLNFLEMYIWQPKFMQTGANQGVFQKSTKTSNFCFVQNMIWRVKRRSSGEFSWMFRKKLEFFSTHIIRILLRGQSWIPIILLTTRFWWFFDMFWQCGQNLVKNLKVESRFQFTREIALNDKCLSRYFPDRKVLWMNFEQLLDIFN